MTTCWSNRWAPPSKYPRPKFLHGGKWWAPHGFGRRLKKKVHSHRAHHHPWEKANGFVRSSSPALRKKEKRKKEKSRHLNFVEHVLSFYVFYNHHSSQLFGLLLSQCFHTIRIQKNPPKQLLVFRRCIETTVLATLPNCDQIPSGVHCPSSEPFI